MDLYVKSRAEWRSWLEENHTSPEGIWLRFYKKPSGQPTVSYEDAVDEALCFGWIDGTKKRVNEHYYIQWFTKRRPASKWSEINRAKMKKLIDQGLVHPQGLKAYKEAGKSPKLIMDKNPEIPLDLLEELKKNSVALDNFMKFPPSSRKLYVFWLNDAKRQETRNNRIMKIVDRAEKNNKSVML